MPTSRIWPADTGSVFLTERCCGCTGRRCRITDCIRAWSWREDPQQAKNAVKWMSDMDLLDDRKTAEQIVSSCIRKGYGLTRAKQALYEKQIPREFWQEVLEDYPDQMEYIVSFLSARLKGDSDEREIRRATDALIRRGHSYGAIRKGLGQLAIDDDFQEE